MTMNTWLLELKNDKYVRKFPGPTTSTQGKAILSYLNT